MITGIRNADSGMLHYMDRRDKLSRDKEATKSENNRQDAWSGSEVLATEDQSPAAQMQKFAQSVDEMTAALAQFRHRRDFEKKTGAAGDTSFDRVLDEQFEPSLEKLLKVLKSPEGANIEDFLRQARLFFSDESDLVLVLRALLNRRDLDEIIRNRLKALLARVEKEAEPKRLKAGINVALKARLYGKKLMMSPALMRESYRKFLESDEHEIDIYQHWISIYGVRKRAIVINFMDEALVSDIDSADPSCSLIEFGCLLNRIGQIKLIRSCDIFFIDGLLSNEFIRKANNDEKDWLWFFFSLLQNPSQLSSLLASTVGEYIYAKKNKSKIRLLRIIYFFLKKMPLEIFYFPEDRDEIFDYFHKVNDLAFLQENIERTLNISDLPEGIIDDE